MIIDTRSTEPPIPHSTSNQLLERLEDRRRKANLQDGFGKSIHDRVATVLSLGRNCLFLSQLWSLLCWASCPPNRVTNRIECRWERASGRRPTIENPVLPANQSTAIREEQR